MDYAYSEKLMGVSPDKLEADRTAAAAAASAAAPKVPTGPLAAEDSLDSNVLSLPLVRRGGGGGGGDAAAAAAAAMDTTSIPEAPPAPPAAPCGRVVVPRPPKGYYPMVAGGKPA